MAWTSPLDSRPLRPVPVLWLLVPWAALFLWTAVTTARVARAAPSPGGQGQLGAMAVLALLGISLWGGVFGLGLTWIWLALAVPGIGRPGLWLAAACFAARGSCRTASMFGTPGAASGYSAARPPSAPCTQS
ncbi:hypothetical protein J421_5307 (plasmid) [Gemmatirosa kalamazoonensis]|uniref:Uncharacterized protein n=1 Tax=Gemmatirosa kalamazoonensis TaxID=861299 RepID=W0RQV1_9BACT|nr:hypothetical protein [Gemmatirosa kalamazoonensis]AHG92842.1 hypothetical protein J421_5307 [Gemmatirosa kalamazoonensis]